jgi:hypothetical protein
MCVRKRIWDRCFSGGVPRRRIAFGYLNKTPTAQPAKALAIPMPIISSPDLHSRPLVACALYAPMPKSAPAATTIAAHDAERTPMSKNGKTGKSEPPIEARPTTAAGRYRRACPSRTK